MNEPFEKNETSPRHPASLGQADASRFAFEDLAALGQGATKDDACALRTMDLVEANERLLLAALEARAAATSAAIQLEAVTRASQRDALTDTPNRALMLDRIAHAIAMARRKRTHIAVLFLDLDHFKRINDTFGHAAGDRALQLVARRITATVRNSDTVSRHGGDEFLVLLTEVADAADAGRISEKIRASLASAVFVPGERLALSASIGIAIYPEDGDDAETLIRRADASMYCAKGSPSTVKSASSDTPATGAGSNASNSRRPEAPRPADAAPQAIPLLAELRQANEELVLAALRAQELQVAAEASLRREIASLAMLAHEFRHPLGPILTAAALLNRVRTEDPLLTRLRGMIERQTHQLTRLVDDLLDKSRLATGKFRLDRSKVGIAPILEEAIETARPAMESRGQHLSIQIPSHALFVDGDRARLTQIFVNLLQNACKYTPVGGWISVGVTAADGEVAIAVADSGIGIEPEALPHVFELYTQGQRGLEAGNSGLGIGLAIARELADAHAGRISVTSAGIDTGSTFVVTLPLMESQPPA